MSTDTIAEHVLAAKAQNEAKTIVVDATGLVVGRMATYVAKQAILGNTIHIVNAEKAIITGASRRAIQERYTFKREVGTMRKGPFFPREPHLLVKRSCRGMIPYQSASGRAAYKRIRAYVGVPKELKDQAPVSVDAARRAAKNYMTVEELSRFLGAPDRGA